MYGDWTDARPRQTACPFCRGSAVDTLAKVITATTCWRCRECEKTWTIASLDRPATRGGHASGHD